MSESCPRKGTIISPLHCSSLSLREWTRNAFLSTAAFGGLPRHSLWTRRGKCVCQSSAKCQECQVPVRGKVQRPLSNIQRERESAFPISGSSSISSSSSRSSLETIQNQQRCLEQTVSIVLPRSKASAARFTKSTSLGFESLLSPL